MSRLIALLCSGGVLVLLTGCEEFLEASSGYSARYEYEMAYDSCDRQAQLCYRSGYDNYACQAQVNRCFSRVYNNARAAGIYFGDTYYFYGRTGYWSPRQGWRFGPHGRSYTIDRYNSYGYPYSRPGPYRYGSPGYDDPNDCYGYRQASYCRDRYYRDRDRDRGGRDRDRDRDGDRGGRGDDNRPPPAAQPTSPPDKYEQPRMGSGSSGGGRPSSSPQPSRPNPANRPQPRAEPPAASPPPSTTPTPRPRPKPSERPSPRDTDQGEQPR